MLSIPLNDTSEGLGFTVAHPGQEMVLKAFEHPSMIYTIFYMESFKCRDSLHKNENAVIMYSHSC